MQRTPYTIHISNNSHGKPAPKYYGPYRIVAKIDSVAYRLLLPTSARIHDVFHVGLLKKYHGTPPDQSPDLPVLLHGKVIPTPDKALCARLYRGVHQILIQWQGQPASAASWEDLADFQHHYPSFQLEDELLAEGERYHVGLGLPPAPQGPGPTGGTCGQTGGNLGATWAGF